MSYLDNYVDLAPLLIAKLTEYSNYAEFRLEYYLAAFLRANVSLTFQQSFTWFISYWNGVGTGFLSHWNGVTLCPDLVGTKRKSGWMPLFLFYLFPQHGHTAGVVFIAGAASGTGIDHSRLLAPRRHRWNSQSQDWQ